MSARARPPARQFRRLREIVGVFARHGFADVLGRLHLPPRLAPGRRLPFPWRVHPREARLSQAQRLRLAFQELGPTFIKFGQALSLRSDLIGPEFIREFSRLQDEVPSLAPGAAERAAEAELGEPLDRVFTRFDPEPVASASIAQVHRARLAGGDEVAVKVRRPGIRETIESDLAILRHLARLAERYLPDAELYAPAQLVEEFGRSIRRELDLAREGHAIERFRRDFRGDPTLRLPLVHWQATRGGLLTLEFIDGVKITDLPRAGALFDTSLVVRRGADIMLKQVLVTGLFHADPHPANLFVLPGNVICLLDFGNVGRIDRPMREALSGLVEAVVRLDAERMAERLLALAEPLTEVNVRDLRRELADLVELYGGAQLRDLSLAEMMTDLFGTISRFRLRFPPELLMLVKTFATVEGVGRQLDPDFRLLEHARPMIQRALAERWSPGEVARRAVEFGRETTTALEALPRDIGEIIRKARTDRLQIQFVHRNLEHFVQEMDRASNRLSFAVVIAALIVGSSLIFQTGGGPQFYGYPALGLAGFLAAGCLGLWLVVGILRSGRL